MELTRLIRDKMMKENLMFVYRGIVTNENSVPLLMLLEKEMENSEFGFVGRKRLFMFVLESLQNVSRHSLNNRHANMSLVVYSKTSTGYTVTTGNVLPNSAKKDLKRKLDAVNKLENKDIRNVYRRMLSSSEFSTKGGAGLGLIEMAKKTGNKLDYDFVKIDDEYSYFVLSKTVDSGGMGIHKDAENTFSGVSYSQLEKIMAESNLYLIWSGHISPDIGKEVISFTETKLSEDDVASNVRRKVFSILVEILENVSKYSPGRIPEEQYGMPMAMIRMEDKVFSLTTGNLILNENVGFLKDKIDIINKYDKLGLKELFRKSLSSQTTETESTGNMGLIEMARKSGSKLDYDFDRINDLYSYYMLNVKVEEKVNQNS
ncbi:MAG TPA: SiaB family protein kinase [Bacteroidales bacterium]|nr:SiaB family protein kinase [Bacteroidales bacterium]